MFDTINVSRAKRHQDDLSFTEVRAFAADHREADQERRRKIRGHAGDLLRRIGYRVALDPGRDIYDVRPIRPVSAHDELRMLQALREACGSRGTAD